MNRKFAIGDHVKIIQGFYADIIAVVTGCYFDGDIPYVTVDFCAVAFYEYALEAASPDPMGKPRGL